MCPRPPCQNSCRLVMILTLGAKRMNDGTARRSIQEQDGSAIAAALNLLGPEERKGSRGTMRLSNRTDNESANPFFSAYLGLRQTNPLD